MPLAEDWDQHAFPSSKAARIEAAFKLFCDSNPDLFKVSTTADLADVTQGLYKAQLTLITSIYEPYTTRQNGRFTRADHERKLTFLKTLHPRLDDMKSSWAAFSDDEKKEIAEELHCLHSAAHGYSSAAVETCIRPPVGKEGEKILSNGSYCCTSRSIFYNIYEPEPGEMVPKFRQGFTPFAILILHESEHAYHDDLWSMCEKGLIKCQDTRDFARMVHYANKDGFYLNTPDVSFSQYEKNPCERHAYEAQDYMELFVNADAPTRLNMIARFESQFCARNNVVFLNPAPPT